MAVETASPPEASGTHVVYFSNVSGNTRRFVERLALPATRIPVRAAEQMPMVSEPYVLIVPTYGGCLDLTGSRGASVPRQVVKFLNVERNRGLCRGVIASGNTNFGADFAVAGRVVSAKLGVPYLYRFELMGTAEDVSRVREGLEELWQHRP